MELFDQDVELGGERRRLLDELLKGLHHPAHGRRGSGSAPSAPLPTDPTRLATSRVRSSNSSIADCSKPYRCVSLSVIATTFVRRTFGAVNSDSIIRFESQAEGCPRRKNRT